MIGLWPLAPDHETDFAASPSTAQCRGAAGPLECRPSLRGGLQGRRLTCPNEIAELTVHYSPSRLRGAKVRGCRSTPVRRGIGGGVSSGRKVSCQTLASADFRIDLELNCPGFSGEQSAKHTNRKLKGRDPCRKESTAEIQKVSSRTRRTRSSAVQRKGAYILNYTT